MILYDTKKTHIFPRVIPLQNSADLGIYSFRSFNSLNTAVCWQFVTRLVPSDRALDQICNDRDYFVNLTDSLISSVTFTV